MKKQLMSKTLLLAMTLALGACAMGPDYIRPAAPVAAVVGSQPADVNTPQWGSYFTDPALHLVIEKALANNRDLKIATARIEEARALYGIQKADFLPSVNANGSGSISRSSPDTDISRRYEANLALLSYEVDFWGRVRRLSEAAKANYLASEEAQQSVRSSLIADVANSYYSAQALTARSNFAEQTATARAENLRVVKRRVDVGVANRLDLLQAQSAQDAAISDHAALARQAANAQTALVVLVGEPVSLPAANLNAEVVQLPGGVNSAVLLERPDVRAAEQKLVAANANIGAARAAFFPKVTLMGSGGVVSNELEDLFSGGNRAWSFLPQISLPLFDGGRLRAGADIAEARKVIAVAEYEKTIQLAFKDAADVLSDQAWLSKQLAAQQRLSERQEQRLKLAEVRYASGLAGYLDVLDAQREFYTASQGLIETRRARLAASAQAYKALGGK
ncbi:efflux transporter outer membrane subunit [Iodobacter ciconiae]|uniref:Efflux transporter outer membrane subunit n=1 Tax=Iodobacter ciconiae TaxID=2496266 RepID=A0A3S8ZRJ7_9NEIS|nr:efflux transporter outer membrane subunit [Iodobacter ciconiae]AZN36112.1 efflux transporter outer membrane subunit [Iodobacter ciconiae]